MSLLTAFRGFPRIVKTNPLDAKNLLCRTFSESSHKPLDLRYEQVNPKTSSDSAATPAGPLVICHGLFGSKQNWRSLSKTFASRLNIPVYSLDLRNHGESPHSETMDYTTMACDVLQFCRTHNLNNISLLGHSMGGKVAMAFALQPGLPHGLLSNLVIADIAPSKGALSSEFRNYTDAMARIEKSRVTTRKEANDIIHEVEQDPSIRAFLLTNLISTHGGAPLKFRVPVDIIQRSLDDIGGFPYEPGEREWKGRTLLVKGEKSHYVNKNNIPIAQQFFPDMRLEVLGASHWVHAEKPHEFVDLVVDFVKST